MRSCFFLIIAMVFLPSISSAENNLLKPWQRVSNPLIMSSTFKRNFSALPLKGQVREIKKYWSSDYWPLFKGSINYRWNSPVPTGFKLNSPNYEQAIKMDRKELEALAPSEKYDLFIGNYSYPLKNQVAKKASPYRAIWEGICHGWAAAALNHNEPLPLLLKNPDGIRIPFGSSDIKALLSYYYAYYYDPVTTHQMGLRCNGRRYCGDDLNAGAFHIVLTNKVGIERKSFIADIDNGTEVWNQVIYNYNTKIIESDLPPVRDSAKGTTKVVRMKTEMKVVFNIVQNNWLPVIGTNLQTFKNEIYEYDLDLNQEGNIIGGDWRSKERPDFLWLVTPEKNFYGIFSELDKLIQDGLQDG